MQGTGDHDTRHRDQRARPERDGDLGDRVNAPIQQRDVDETHADDEHDHPGPR